MTSLPEKERKDNIIQKDGKFIFRMTFDQKYKYKLTLKLDFNLPCVESINSCKF